MDREMTADEVGAHLAQARENARFCILCKYITRSYDQNGSLRDLSNFGVTVPVASQVYHLRVCARPKNHTARVEATGTPHV